MTRTRTDLIVNVLDLLGVSQEGQDPSAEDMQLVDREIDGKLAALSRRNVVFVPDSDAIEQEYFLPLAKIVANAVGLKFGVSYDPDVDAREEATLREMQPEPGVNDTVRAEYF